MDLATLRDFLLWCLVINYSILLVWFFAFMFARDWMHRLHSRWFRLTDEQFDAAHYISMSIYKLGIILFIFVPWIALHIVA